MHVWMKLIQLCENVAWSAQVLERRRVHDRRRFYVAVTLLTLARPGENSCQHVCQWAYPCGVAICFHVSVCTGWTAVCLMSKNWIFMFNQLFWNFQLVLVSHSLPVLPYIGALKFWRLGVSRKSPRHSIVAMQICWTSSVLFNVPFQLLFNRHFHIVDIYRELGFKQLVALNYPTVLSA
jgi:hypothetical protein